VWARQIADSTDEVSRGVAVGPTGNVFLSGIFYGDLDLGGAVMTTQGSADFFLASFDTDGNHRWTKSFGDASDQRGASWFLAPTADGGVVLAGWFSGTLDFGGGPRSSSAQGGFVVRLDADGHHLWSNVFGSPDAYNKAFDVAVDPISGDVVVGGFFVSEIDLGDGPVTGNGDGFVARFDSASGALVWHRLVAGPDTQFVASVDVDALGRVAFGGATYSDTDLGNGVQTAQNDGWRDPFAALYDGETPVWTKLWADPGDDELYRLRFTSDGMVVAGDMDSSISFEGSPPVSATTSVFAAKLAIDGSHVHSKAFQNVRQIDAMTVDHEKTLIAGQFDQQTSSESGPIKAVGGNDGIVLSLSGSLEYDWTTTFGSADEDDAHGIAVDAVSNVYLAVHFRDDITIPGCGTFANRGGWDIVLLKRRP
jgi:hypothetical protein